MRTLAKLGSSNAISKFIREAAEKEIAKIEQMAKDLGIPSGFAELGAKEDIETLATNAMKDATATTNPRKPKLQEVMEIIKNAM